MHHNLIYIDKHILIERYIKVYDFLDSTYIFELNTVFLICTMN